MSKWAELSVTGRDNGYPSLTKGRSTVSFNDLKRGMPEHPQIVTFNAKWHDLLAVCGTIRDRHEEAAARLIVL